MRSDDMAGAIADGIAMHAKAHPEDAARRIDESLRINGRPLQKAPWVWTGLRHERAPAYRAALGVRLPLRRPEDIIEAALYVMH